MVLPFLCIFQPEIILLKSYLTVKTCRCLALAGAEPGLPFSGGTHYLLWTWPFSKPKNLRFGSSRQGCKSNGVRVPYRQLPESGG